MRAFSDREGGALSTPVYWEEKGKWGWKLTGERLLPGLRRLRFYSVDIREMLLLGPVTKRGVFRKFMWKQYAELIEVAGLK